jgi:hypothetical protein
MPKERYIVTQREVWVRASEVLADSSEEAITAVEAGEGEELEGLFEYSHTLGRENTTTEISPGPSVYYVAKGDYYTLTQPNWAQFHYDSAVKAITMAELFRPTLKEKLGIEPNNVVVLYTECWANGDCCRTVFDPELVKVQKV